ncbi:kinase-like domain-containing protein [Melampsora americana]|nr:kinase-like domain-containing protein [Melampsora americana]
MSSHHNSSTSSVSSSPSSSTSSKKKLLRLFHLRDPAVQAQKKQFSWGSHLGSGTYGEVSKCVWKTHQPRMEVAIKVVPKSKVPNHEQQERLLNHTLNLKHPHIVSLHHWFHSRHHYYMVFELAQGGELFDHIISHGRFNETDTRKMITDLTSAVLHIHSQNIVHRDLKPENLFVRGTAPKPPFDLVIADFGVAVILPSSDAMINGVCGSPGYTAPEVYQRRPYGKAVDIWSLGVITFILLCGRFPFAKLQGPEFLEEIMDQTKRTKNGTIKLPKAFGLSQEAEEFIGACLQIDPEKRLTAEEALNHKWLVGPDSIKPLKTKPSKPLSNRLSPTDSETEVELIEFPSSSTSPENHLAEVRFCRTRTISEGPRAAM